MGNTRDTAFIPEVLEDTVRANFKGKKALLGSLAVVTMASMPLSARGGDKIEVPYFDLLGDLEDVNEGVALSVATIPDGSREEASVARAGKAIRLSDWKRMAENFADPYAEYTRQLNEAVGRRWDRALIAAAANTSGLPSSHIIDRYDGSTPVKLSWQFALDGRRPFGDEQEDVVGMVIHSKAYFDLVAEVARSTRARPSMGTSSASLASPSRSRIECRSRFRRRRLPRAPRPRRSRSPARTPSRSTRYASRSRRAATAERRCSSTRSMAA